SLVYSKSGRGRDDRGRESANGSRTASAALLAGAGLRLGLRSRALALGAGRRPGRTSFLGGAKLLDLVAKPRCTLALEPLGGVEHLASEGVQVLLGGVGRLVAAQGLAGDGARLDLFLDPA